MAGRPRLYDTKAEKMRAYRQRLQNTTLLVDRWGFEQTDLLLKRLMDTVHQAQSQGHPLARSLQTKSRFDLLESLIRLFEPT